MLTANNPTTNNDNMEETGAIANQ